MWPLLPYGDRGHNGGIGLAGSLAAAWPAPGTCPALGTVWTVGAPTCSAPPRLPDGLAPGAEPQ